LRTLRSPNWATAPASVWSGSSPVTGYRTFRIAGAYS